MAMTHKRWTCGVTTGRKCAVATAMGPLPSNFFSLRESDSSPQHWPRFYGQTRPRLLCPWSAGSRTQDYPAACSGTEQHREREATCHCSKVSSPSRKLRLHPGRTRMGGNSIIGPERKLMVSGPLQKHLQFSGPVNFHLEVSDTKHLLTWKLRDC